MFFNRPPPPFPYRLLGPHGVTFGPPPPFLLTPPPPPSFPPIHDNTLTLIAEWEAEISPAVEKRREELNVKKKISLLDFKRKLIRWKELLQNPDDPGAQAELECLQRECSDPETIQLMKRRIKRNERRKGSRQELLLVKRTGVAEVLSRLPLATKPGSSSQTPSRNEVVYASVHAKQQRITSETVKETEDQPIKRCLVDLREASAFCQANLRILDKLKLLRQARLSQARGQGKLIPEEMDEAFEKRRYSLKLDIEMMQKKLNKVVRRLESTERESTLEKDKLVTGDDDTVTSKDLPEDVHYLLFGSRGVDINTRWNKFYCQANRNFSDFVRIRSRWDEYLVLSDSVQPPDSTRHLPSLLPVTWHLPTTPST